MSVVKKITTLSMTAVIVAACLTGCGDYNTEDMSDASNVTETPEATEIAADITESKPLETPNEPIPAPETYEDYMKLAAASYQNEDWEIAHDCYHAAKELDGSRVEVYRGLSDTYLQMGDVIQALDVLEEGIEKLSIEEQGIDGRNIDYLSQRKEYILAGTVAIRTKYTENEYDDEGSILSSRVLECNENGNEIKDIYSKGGEISRSAEYQYDAGGNRIEYKYIIYLSSGNSHSSRQTWSYDENGNEIDYVSYDENGNIEKHTKSEYDADGNRIRYTKYDENDKITEWTETAYDENGNEIKREAYYKYGSSIRTIFEEYDEHENLINYTVYDTDGKLIQKAEYEYDKNDNRVRSVRYDDGVTISYMIEQEYDENGNEVKYVTYSDNGEIISYWDEKEYNENGNVIKQVNYDSEGIRKYIQEYGYDENGRQIYIRYNVDEYTWEYEYDEHGNRVKEIYTSYDRKTGQKEYKSRRWEREYDEEGRNIAAFFYDNEKTASYQSKAEYDENGLIINYTNYDKNGDILGKRETEYDSSGQVIRENYYDANGNLFQYYENEYDVFGGVIRQAMYEDGILKSEKQVDYLYRYIGYIDAEASDYRDDDTTPEEYNLKQREIFIRFLQGQEKISYYDDLNSVDKGKIVGETITDLIDFAYYTENREDLKYAFLDMTGDGIEELIIKCSDTKLYVIQSDYGILRVICDAVGGNFGAYLVKYDGRMGVCCDFGGHVGGNEEYYYFFDGKGKKEIILGDYQCFLEDGTESRGYCISDNYSFESRDISAGEYYDIADKIVREITIDWQKLEKPNK